MYSSTTVFELRTFNFNSEQFSKIKLLYLTFDTSPGTLHSISMLIIRGYVGFGVLYFSICMPKSCWSPESIFMNNRTRSNLLLNPCTYNCSNTVLNCYCNSCSPFNTNNTHPVSCIVLPLTKFTLAIFDDNTFYLIGSFFLYRSQSSVITGIIGQI